MIQTKFTFMKEGKECNPSFASKLEDNTFKSLILVCFKNCLTVRSNHYELTDKEDWSVIDDQECLDFLNEVNSFKQQGGKIFVKYIYS